METNKSAKSVLITVMALALFSGCAVLTIDVDVYKGALANHEDVQTEQLVSMAMGAKPLLIQLRDHLEWGPADVRLRYEHGGQELISKPITDLQSKLAYVRTNNRAYLCKFMPGYPFEREPAIRVNAILSLYEDQSSTNLTALIEEGRRALNDYQRYYRIFRLTPLSEEEELWQRLSKGFKDVHPNDADAALIAAYRSLCVPGTDGWRVEKLLFTSSIARSDFYNTKVVEPNERFHLLLQDKNKLNTDADRLFRPNSAEREMFTRKVTDIAGAFLKSREALHRIYQLALIGLTQVELRRDCSSAAAKEALIDLISEMTRPALVKEALYSAKDVCPELLKLRRFVTNVSVPATNITAAATNVTVATADITASDLRNLLTSDALGISYALLQLDGSVYGNTNNFKLFFGLERGPTPEVGDLSAKAVTRLFQGLQAGGLERGRIPIGLETLIENYLFEGHRNPTAKQNADVIRERERLLDALVNFAQKVLFLSNYSTLLDDTNDPQLQQYLLVLQAVGNSLLVQADELRQQAAYHEHRVDRRDATIAAVTNAGFTNISILTNAADSKTVIAQLIDALRLEYINELRNGATTLLTNEVHTFTTNVTLTATNAVTNVVASGSVTASRSTTSHANSLQAAIEAATEMRANQIYLRPASAYLRNSYPATSLQKNAPLEWNNMLAEHAGHQIPIFGGLASPDSSRDRKAAREIDKQFWQNINRVRLSGAGNVNYVVAKDDVGNWYVKQFSAQPSNIVNSAKNLAFFAAGPSLGANLPIRKSDGTTLFSADSTNGVSGPSILGRQFARATSTYTNDTAQFYDMLVNTATNDLPSRLHTALGTNASLLSPVISNLVAGISKDFPPSADAVLRQGQDPGTKADELLKAIRRVSFPLSQAINGTNTLAPDVRKLAEGSAQRVIREVLDDAIQKREGVLSRYESSLNLIGSSASP